MECPVNSPGSDRVERHPLEPFLPREAKILMLGSFPPARSRWSMDFYYPNFQNDMWRVMGVVFFGDRDRFVVSGAGRFDRQAIEEFCRQRGIALSDTAAEVIRTRDNASDKYLQVVSPFDPGALLERLPLCRTVAVTGQKAADTFAEVMGCEVPAAGGWTEFTFQGRPMRLYRMPSTSRAYPKPLDQKAEAYRKMFCAAGVL